MENKIIMPCHNKVTKNCPSWKYIKHEAECLRKFIQEGKFEGDYDSAFAISHAQVSNTPLNFFVINEKTEKGILKKHFGSWCMINPRIVAASDPVSWEEGCMGFPHRRPKRINRLNKIKAVYYVPFLWTWRKVTRRLKGLPAFIVQHEIEHCQGKNIYFKK